MRGIEDYDTIDGESVEKINKTSIYKLEFGIPFSFSFSFFVILISFNVRSKVSPSGRHQSITGVILAYRSYHLAEVAAPAAQSGPAGIPNAQTPQLINRPNLARAVDFAIDLDFVWWPEEHESSRK